MPHVLIRRIPMITAVAAALCGCGDTTPPTASAAAQPRRPILPLAAELVSARPVPIVKSQDERLAEVAEDVPEFAGVFVAADGTPTLLLTAGREDASIAGRVRSAFEARALPALAMLLADGKPRQLAAKYSFAELYRWRAAIVADGWPAALGSLSIDERRNLVVLGIRAGHDPAALVERAGVPVDAYEIVDHAEPRLAASLRSSFRPLRGGIKVTLKNGAWVNEYCTITYPTHYGFAITNSHCTKQLFAWDYALPSGYTYLHQPTTASASVAWESFDTPHNPSIGTCPPATNCRWSEAALFALSIAYTVPPRIVKTTGRVTGYSNTSSLTTSGTLTVTAESMGWPVVGATLDKIGASTGWTYGTVVEDCFDIMISDVLLKCQIKIDNIGVLGGDSGAPVFTYLSSSQATLSGILWGSVVPAPGPGHDPGVPNGGIYVSPYIGIVSDLGYQAWALEP